MNPAFSEQTYQYQQKLAKEKKEGRLYRLPTEAEWEYACRAGSAGKYCYGDDESILGDCARYSKNSNEKKHPVGRKRPNAWGLYDMHGNVSEWCADWYDYKYYANSPTNDPMSTAGGRATGGSRRMVRGGGWPLDAGTCRSAFRQSDDRDDKRNFRGLRVATVSLDNGGESVGVRTWTDATGKYRVEAELIDFTDGVVRLQKEDEQVIALPLEKLSPADQRFLERKPAGDESRRDGFLVETGDGLYYVDLNGETEPFAETRNVIVGRPAVFGNRVFFVANGAIQEFDPRGKPVRAMAITNLVWPKWDANAIRYELNRSRLFVLPQGGSALLSPGSDRVYFLNERGVWRRTVEVLEAGNWPDLLGTVAGEGLLVSNNSWTVVRRVDLKTFNTELFMRGGSSCLGPIAFDPQRKIYYACSNKAIHAVSMKGNRGPPDVSEAPKIATVVAHFEARSGRRTVRPSFINGIVLDGEFAYVTLIPYGCIVRVNIATGEAKGFVQGLTSPDILVRLKEPD